MSNMQGSGAIDHRAAAGAAAFIQYGILISLLGSILGVVLGRFLATGDPAQPPDWVAIASNTISLGGAALFFIGILRFAPIEPMPDGRSGTLRGLAIASIALSGAGFALAMIGFVTGQLAILALGTIIGLTDYGITIALLVVLLGRAMAWASVLGDMTLAKHAKSARISVPLLMTIGIVIFIGPLLGIVVFYNRMNMLRKLLRASVA